MQTLLNLFKTVASPVYIYGYTARRFSFIPSTTGNIASVITGFYTYDADGIITTFTDTATGTTNTQHVDFQGKAENHPSFDTPCSAEQDTSITAHITIKTHPGILYYGYRYYSPDLGRWVSRDPAEEDGGLNLYASFANAPTILLDYLGLSWCTTTRKNIGKPSTTCRKAASLVFTTAWAEYDGVYCECTCELWEIFRDFCVTLQKVQVHLHCEFDDPCSNHPLISDVYWQETDRTSKFKQKAERMVRQWSGGKWGDSGINTCGINCSKACGN